MAHLAPTYASVLTLATVGTPEALASIDRYRQQTKANVCGSRFTHFAELDQNLIATML
jgi:hypothetical protein